MDFARALVIVIQIYKYKIYTDRFWAMDPTATGPLLHVPPESDGSSCTDMADSLREALKEDFDTRVSVHFNPISGEEYRQSMECCWGWLDEKTLLQSD